MHGNIVLHRHWLNSHRDDHAMKCDWEFTGEVDDRGWRKVQCTRADCGTKSGWTPHDLDHIFGECQGWPRWWELGYIVEFGLALLGINQQRFNTLRRLLGFVQPCKCGERVEALNESGGWLKDRIDVMKAMFRRIKNHKEPKP